MVNHSDRTIALVIVTLASALTPFTVSAVNIALPTIGKELGFNAVTLGWIPTAYLLASAIFLLPLGRLADIFGRRRMFTLGVGIFGLACLLIANTPSAHVLLALRVLEGIGGAMIAGTGVAILTSIYPANEKGRVLGINTAAVYLGLSVGPTFGGFLTQEFGWRSLFLFNVPLTAIIAGLALWGIHGEWAEAHGDSFDFVGTIVYGLSLLAIIYGFSSLPNESGLLLIVAGVLGMAIFIAWELRSPSPVLAVRVFRGNMVFTFSNLAALINYSATSASGFLLSLYLQQIRGYSAEVAGLILIAQPIVQAVFSPVAGRLSDTIEPRLLASLGMGLNAVGLFAFIFLNPQTPLFLIVAQLMLLGLGFALFSSPNTNAVMSSVEKRHYGVASASLSTMRVVGQTMSIGLALLVFALYMGRVAITPAMYPQLMTSTRIIYSMLSVLCVAGVVASLARGTMHQPADKAAKAEAQGRRGREE